MIAEQILRKDGFDMEVTRSCEDKNKVYITFPDGLRLIVDHGEYTGWYICK